MDLVSTEFEAIVEKGCHQPADEHSQAFLEKDLWKISRILYWIISSTSLESSPPKNTFPLSITPFLKSASLIICLALISFPIAINQLGDSGKEHHMTANVRLKMERASSKSLHLLITMAIKLTNTSPKANGTAMMFPWKVLKDTSVENSSYGLTFV